MADATAIITHPISLCAYVLSAVIGLLARKWNSKSRRRRDRQLFYFAASLAVIALAGGLLLAWRQIERGPTLSHRAEGDQGRNGVSTTQNSQGPQSPNVNGSGNVTIQYGTGAPGAERAREKNK
jgi:hypothetical protein